MMKHFCLLSVCLFCLMSCSQNSIVESQLVLSCGHVDRVEHFESKFVLPRTIDIWLPDGYSYDKRYAVLYMHDGQMLFDSTITWNRQEWGVDEVMKQLIEEKTVRHTIVVGIWNTEFRHSEYFPQEPFENLPEAYRDSFLMHAKRNQADALFKTKVCSDNYLNFITKELKPYIDRNYATHSDVNHTFIAGSSMGGLISLYALCEYPDVFGGAACLSTHWVGIFDTVNNPIPMEFAKYLEQYLPPPDSHSIYFDYGTETLDALYEPFQNMVDTVMMRRGYTDNNWITLRFEGANHSEKAWNNRLRIPFLFLLGRKNKVEEANK